MMSIEMTERHGSLHAINIQCTLLFPSLPQNDVHIYTTTTTTITTMSAMRMYA